MATTARSRGTALYVVLSVAIVGTFYGVVQAGLWLDRRYLQRMSEDAERWRAQFELDVKEGRRLRTGEPVITDDTTGCKYIKTSFYIGQEVIGHVLTPRSDEHGKHMGCGKR